MKSISFSFFNKAGMWPLFNRYTIVKLGLLTLINTHKYSKETLAIKNATHDQLK